MSFDLLSAIKNIAPMIAGTFGTPLAGLAVSALCSVIPGEQAAPVQAAMASSGAESALAKVSDLFQQGIINTAQIKQAEQVHAEKMAELGYKNVADLEKIAADDRASARGMQTAVRSWVPAALAVAVTAGFFGVLTAMMLGTIKSPNNDALLLMLGSLGTAWGAIISFYFGSSASSKDKDATLAEIAKAP